MATALIVEDNPSFRGSLTELLTARFPQMAVDDVGSGEEALERMESLRPDLMFVDIRLPGQNGLELTRQVRKDNTEVSSSVSRTTTFWSFAKPRTKTS